jgi:polyisoprenoid-binding protein YceI
MSKNSLWLAVALAQLAAPALAANSWHFDTAHSGASFKIKHLMVANVNGTMNGVSGKAEYDGKAVKTMKVEAQLDAATINTGDAGRDKHLKSADFFDVEKYPTITFKSKKIIGRPGAYKLVGDLTMHGVTKEVALNMENPSPVVKDPKGNEHVGTSAHTKVQRSAFGISYNKQLDQGGVMVGDDVDITLDVDLVKDKESANSGAPKKQG